MTPDDRAREQPPSTGPISDMSGAAVWRATDEPDPIYPPTPERHAA